MALTVMLPLRTSFEIISEIARGSIRQTVPTQRNAFSDTFLIARFPFHDCVRSGTQHNSCCCDLTDNFEVRFGDRAVASRFVGTRAILDVERGLQHQAPSSKSVDVNRHAAKSCDSIEAYHCPIGRNV